MEVRACVPIRAGEELVVSYLGTCSLEPRHVRQAQLLASKFFACACSRCKEPLDTSTDRFLQVLPNSSRHVSSLGTASMQAPFCHG